MPTFSEAVQESGRLALCALFAGNEAVNALLSPIAGDSFGLYPLTSGLRRKNCSDDPANDPQIELPFAGGQCPDTVYLITWTVNNVGVPPFQNQSDRIGPLTLSRALEPGDTNAGCDAGQPFNRYTMLSSGTPLGLGSGCGTTVTNIQVSPLFDGPNNCGDPPPPPLGEPGDVVYEAPDITYNIDGDTTITVPIAFTFSPVYVALDGSLNIPVTFDVGGVEFSGEVTVSPEFNFSFGPKGVTTGPGIPDDPFGGIPIPEENDESTIIGVLVFSQIAGENNATVLPSQNGPDFYVPRIGSVQFAIKTGNSIAWTSDQDVKNLECYVPCPAPQGAVAVRATPAPGVTRTFTAVRGKPLTPA